MTPFAAPALALAAALAGCAAAHRAPEPPPAALPRTFTLAPGERIRLDATAALRYLGVRADSRCPPQVQCVHAGSAQVALRLERAGGDADATLETPRAPVASAAGWRIALLRLEFGPKPAATLRVERDASGR